MNNTKNPPQQSLYQCSCIPPQLVKQVTTKEGKLFYVCPKPKGQQCKYFRPVSSSEIPVVKQSIPKSLGVTIVSKPVPKISPAKLEALVTIKPITVKDQPIKIKTQIKKEEQSPTTAVIINNKTNENGKRTISYSSIDSQAVKSIKIEKQEEIKSPAPIVSPSLPIKNETIKSPYTKSAPIIPGIASNTTCTTVEKEPIFDQVEEDTENIDFADFQYDISTEQPIKTTTAPKQRLELNKSVIINTDIKREFNNNTGQSKGVEIEPSKIPIQYKCGCGLQIALRRSGSSKNYGRYYYICSLPENDSNKCSFWKWEDDIMIELNDPRAPISKEQILYRRVYEGRELKRIDDINACGSYEESWEAGQSLGNPIPNSYQLPSVRKKNPQVTRKELLIEIIARLAELKEFNVTLASSYQEVYHYCDLRILKGQYNKECDAWLYIRYAQKINPTDLDVQYEKFWIQLHGIRPKDNGWLIGGDSHLIVFEVENGFVFIDRKSLWEYVDKTVSKKEYTSNPADAIGKRFRMDSVNGSKNEIKTLVSLQDLRNWGLVYDEWFYTEDMKEFFMSKIQSKKNSSTNSGVTNGATAIISAQIKTE